MAIKRLYDNNSQAIHHLKMAFGKTNNPIVKINKEHVGLDYYKQGIFESEVHSCSR
jgi:hypothetical protein